MTSPSATGSVAKTPRPRPGARSTRVRMMGWVEVDALAMRGGTLLGPGRGPVRRHTTDADPSAPGAGALAGLGTRRYTGDVKRTLLAALIASSLAACASEEA